MTSNPLILLLFLLSAVNPCSLQISGLQGTPWGRGADLCERRSQARAHGMAQHRGCSWRRSMKLADSLQGSGWTGLARWSACSEIPRNAGEFAFHLTFRLAAKGLRPGVYHSTAFCWSEHLITRCCLLASLLYPQAGPEAGPSAPRQPPGLVRAGTGGPFAGRRCCLRPARPSSRSCQ